MRGFKLIEGVGKAFDLSQYMDTRMQTKLIVEKFKTKLAPGMNEEQGHEVLESLMKDFFVTKKWHPTKFRIGSNTVKSFREKSDPGISLKKDDICFVDIGPVINNHEGDYGETIVLGNSEEHKFLKNSVKEIFDFTKTQWKEFKLSGEDLYKIAEKKADEIGVSLNPKMQGHRLGDFPHALFFKGSLGETKSKVSPNLWVLEILIQNKEGTLGAFHEDILI